MNSEKQYESALHQALCRDDEQLRSELRGKGLDPEGEANALRSMIFIALSKAPCPRSRSEVLAAQSIAEANEVSMPARRSEWAAIGSFDIPPSFS